MYDRILLPTDGSDGTEQALSHAVEIATGRDATIHALSVIDRRLYLAADETRKSELKSSLRDDARAAVDRVADGAADAGVDCTTAVRDGVPARVILEYAAERPVDLVVMGTHGRSGRDKLANLGSVTERVVENVDAPILVVRIDRGGGDEAS